MRGTTATIDYNDSAVSLLVTNFGGSLDMAGEEAGEEWNSGEPITVTLVDEDRNKNTNSDEDLTVATTTIVPTITMGTPISIAENHNSANVSWRDCDGISGICYWNTDVATTAAVYSNSPIWTLTFGVTVGSVGDGLTGSSATLNGVNTSLAQKYVSYDVSSLCKADTVGIASATSQANKGVVIRHSSMDSSNC